MESNIKAAFVSGVFILAVALVGLHFWENEPPTITALTPSPLPPQIEGTPIEWTVEAKDPDDHNIYFQFRLMRPKRTYEIVTENNWTTQKHWTWNPTHSDIGENNIEVLVMDRKHSLPENDGDDSCIFPNYTIINKTTPRLTSQNVLISDYREMIQYVKHPFMVIVAQNESIPDAKKLFPNEVEINEGGKPSFRKNESKVVEEEINVPKSKGVKVSLESDGTFEIEPKGNFIPVQQIPEENPSGQNFATWEWWVTPTELDQRTLTVKAFSVDPEKPDSQLRLEQIKIDVKVKTSAEDAMFDGVVNETEAAEPAATEEAATKAVAETEAAAEEAVNKTTTAAEGKVTETAAEAEGAAKEAANETAEAAKEAAPGFESIFAISGLLAVAYLVLGRKGRKNY